jgi:hypothetical protein
MKEQLINEEAKECEGLEWERNSEEGCEKMKKIQNEVTREC